MKRRPATKYPQSMSRETSIWSSGSPWSPRRHRRSFHPVSALFWMLLRGHTRSLARLESPSRTVQGRRFDKAVTSVIQAVRRAYHRRSVCSCGFSQCLRSDRPAFRFGSAEVPTSGSEEVLLSSGRGQGQCPRCLVESKCMRQFTGQESNSTRSEFLAVISHPNRHAALDNEECLVVGTVNVNRRCIAPLRSDLDNGELTTGGC